MAGAKERGNGLCGWIPGRQAVAVPLDDPQAHQAEEGKQRGSPDAGNQHRHERPPWVSGAEQWGIADAVEERGDDYHQREEAHAFDSGESQPGHPFGLRPVAVHPVILSAHQARCQYAREQHHWEHASTHTDRKHLIHALRSLCNVLGRRPPPHMMVLMERVLVNPGDGKTACYVAASGERSNRR